ERLKDNVEGLTKAEMPDSPLLACDVTKQNEVDETFKLIGQEFGRLDCLIHSIAFAPREALEGNYLKTDRNAFVTALEISAYSLTHREDRKSTRLNSSHVAISYAVFCLKKKTTSRTTVRALAVCEWAA